MSEIEKESLSLIGNADKYNLWIFKEMKPFLKSPVLEVGCGIGTITELILKNYQVTSTDLDKKYIESLKKKFKNRKYFKGAYVLNLSQPLKVRKKFNTIVCTNVLHHIKSDNKAIINIFNLLNDGGILFIQEPAHKSLFGTLDNFQNHYRRYQKNELTKKLEILGFMILKANYFNKLGAVGWFINSKLLNRKEMPKNQLSIFNKLVPMINILDKLIPKIFGLSVIIVASKPYGRKN